MCERRFSPRILKRSDNTQQIVDGIELVVVVAATFTQALAGAGPAVISWASLLSIGL
jgi:hypothetical protein